MEITKNRTYNNNNMVITENDSRQSDTNAEVDSTKPRDTPRQLGVERRRWVILFISCTAIFLRGFNQSCYGPINNVFVKYLRIQPWQVDWFILTKSVVFLSMALPLSWFTSRLGFKTNYIFMTVTLTMGFVLTTVGVSLRTGYASIIVGQCIMGFSNIISWSIPPPTAAIWFPTNEVATAVALQVVGRGLGESVGSILTPVLVNVDQSISTIGFRLLLIFIVVSVISASLCVAVLLFVVEEPKLPPSESRAKAIEEKQRKGSLQDQSFTYALHQYKEVIKDLFTNRYFVAVWFVFGVINPVLRNNNVLLSSVLHTEFFGHTHLNTKAGFVLMGGWIACPLITKTKKYKHIVLFSVMFECISAFLVMLGMKLRILVCVYVGVVSTGLFLGMANTSLFELILEISYPKSPLLVTMINVSGLGIFRLLYPIVGRLMLNDAASTAIPFALLLMATIIMLTINPPYKRLEAEMGENKRLIEEDD